MLCLRCEISSGQESQLDRDLDSAWAPGSIPVDSGQGAVPRPAQTLSKNQVDLGGQHTNRVLLLASDARTLGRKR